jgi:branched-chain amino acid transport system ATP-binding protein
MMVSEDTSRPIEAVSAETAPVILAIDNLSAAYGKRGVLYEVSLRLRQGEIVTVLGHNGAGKTTLLRSILGIVRQRSGSISYFGQPIIDRPYYQNVASGISYTPADSPVFRSLGLEENLRLGAFAQDQSIVDEQLDLVWRTFPKLRERRGQLAGTLSGGEQRMLAIGIALVMRPRLMLFDEPSVGLSPAIAQGLLETVSQLCKESGTSALLVDQNVRAALRVAKHVYYLRMGRVLLSETTEAALEREHYWDLF